MKVMMMIIIFIVTTRNHIPDENDLIMSLHIIQTTK